MHHNYTNFPVLLREKFTTPLNCAKRHFENTQDSGYVVFCTDFENRSPTEAFNGTLDIGFLSLFLGVSEDFTQFSSLSPKK